MTIPEVSIYLTVDFRFSNDKIKRLKTRKTTIVRGLGLAEEAVRNIEQVQGPSVEYGIFRTNSLCIKFKKIEFTPLDIVNIPVTSVEVERKKSWSI